MKTISKCSDVPKKETKMPYKPSEGPHLNSVSSPEPGTLLPGAEDIPPRSRATPSPEPGKAHVSTEKRSYT
ncbi:hypothetical protein BANORC5_36260 [Bacteroides nordii]|nr:hypothetical protein BANORC5_36260 [Bacteroides nordii]